MEHESLGPGALQQYAYNVKSLPNLAQFVTAKLLECSYFPHATAVHQQGDLVGMWNLGTYRAEEWALPGDMVATWHPAG